MLGFSSSAPVCQHSWKVDRILTEPLLKELHLASLFVDGLRESSHHIPRRFGIGRQNQRSISSHKNCQRRRFEAVRQVRCAHGSKAPFLRNIVHITFRILPCTNNANRTSQCVRSFGCVFGFSSNVVRNLPKLEAKTIDRRE